MNNSTSNTLSNTLGLTSGNTSSPGFSINVPAPTLPGTPGVLSLPNYSGNINQYLNKQLLQPDWQHGSTLSNALGTGDLSPGYQFQSGGQVYQVINNGNGTRSIQPVGSVASIENQQAQQGASNFLNQYQSAIGSLPSTSNIYSSLASELGITPLQNSLTQESTALTNLPSQTQAEGTATGMTAQQEQELTNQRASQLSPEVQSLANALGVQSQSLGTLIGATMQQEQTALQPWELAGNLVSSTVGAATQLMTQEQLGSFDSVLNQISLNQQVSEQDALMANKWSQQVAQYSQNPSLFMLLNQTLNPLSYSLAQSAGGSSGGSVYSGGIPSVGTSSADGTYSIVG